MNKKVLLPVLGAILLAGTVYTTSTVSAQSTNGNGSGQTIIQRLAEKFGLAETDVQAVFDEERTAHQEQMQAQYEERLTEAVSNGDLTEAQKQLILAKHEELEAAHEADRGQMGQMKDMTTQERAAEREKRQAERDALQAWADENGIDMQYVMGFGGPGGHGGPGMGGRGDGFGPGAPEDAGNTQTQSN